MNREDLLKHANIAMDVAKQDLLKRGKVLPTLLMTFPDKPGIISPVPEEKIVPLILRRENPDAFTYTAEVWIRDSKQLERRDVVQVVAATGPTRIISRMGFRRQDNTVIFDEVQVLTDEQFNQSVVDLGLHDDILGEILGVWAPAPSGGRVFHIGRGGYKIWIPEGWRIGSEKDDKEPDGTRTTWWRVMDPHGAVRVSRYYNTSGNPLQPIMEARREAEIRRGGKAENLQLEQNSATATVSWSQTVPLPTGGIQRGHFWKRFEKDGAVFVSFSCDAKTAASDVHEEVSVVREIVSRIVLLSP